MIFHEESTVSSTRCLAIVGEKASIDVLAIDIVAIVQIGSSHAYLHLTMTNYEKRRRRAAASSLAMLTLIDQIGSAVTIVESQLIDAHGLLLLLLLLLLIRSEQAREHFGHVSR